MSDCTESKVLVDRTWVFLVWDVNLTSSRVGAAGMRLNALNVVNQLCLAASPAAVQQRIVPRLSEAEIEMIKQYEPAGEQSEYAKCVSENYIDEGVEFLQSADGLAAARSLERQIGPVSLHDTVMLLVDETPDCFGQLPVRDGASTANANAIYADLTWLLLMKPNLPAIIQWNEGLAE
jgi:hypothetical protein